MRGTASARGSSYTVISPEPGEVDDDGTARTQDDPTADW
jgi:hypothetical protein